MKIHTKTSVLTFLFLLLVLCFSNQSFAQESIRTAKAEKSQHLIDHNNTPEAGSKVMYTISGKITDSITGLPLANKQVIFDKSMNGPPWAIAVMTNEFGEYSMEQEAGWENTLDPRITGFYYIKPFTRSYAPLTADVPNQDYKFINFEKPLPSDWLQPSTGVVHTIAVEITSDPDVCGMELQLGDLIGAFYYDDNGELACGGYGRWQNENNVAVQLAGNDTYTTEKDGFANLEVLNWFFYSYQMNENISANAEFRSGSILWSQNKFYPSGLSKIKEMDATFPNTMTIPEGWSGLSSYTPPGSIVLTQALAPISDELIIIQDMTKMYYPAIGVNTMYIWNSNKGYKIKLSAEAELSWPGCTVDNTTVSLSSGWNILPVLSQCNVLITDLFSANMDKVTVIKEIAGNRIFWPAMGIQTLQILEPGKAYFISVTQNTSLSYGGCNSAKNQAISNKVTFTNSTPWNDVVPTGANHTIAFPSDVISKLNTGDYIGAFTQEGICAGMVQINNNRENTALTIFGDDAFTAEKDGFVDAENLYFKVFDTQTAEESNVNISFDASYASADGRFTDNGLSVVDDLKFSSTGISTVNQIARFYPNPTSGLVEFNTTDNGLYTISIQNMNGQEILQKTISGSAQLNLSSYSKGIYVVKIDGKNYNTIEKLIIK
jgi:hypothetical protein